MKGWLRVVGALALVVASGVHARAQMGAARGKVVDEDGKPVAGATVELLFLGEVDRKFTTETNGKGQYTQMANTGRYRITATKKGYQGTYIDQRIETGVPTDIPTLTLVSRETAVRKAMAPVLEQFEKAAELSAAGKLDEAIAIYRAVEKEHPKIPELYFNLGTMYSRQEKWQEAEAEYLKAIELAPDNVDGHVLLAEVHKNMGRADEAVAALEKLVDEKPNDAKLNYELGRFYLSVDRQEDAFASFQKVRELDPENVNVLYLLGTLSINQSNVEQAVSFLQSYLDKAPEDAPWRANASELLSKLQPEDTPESQ
jgi:cytochrome c-type biogenesis protein CcmH/NrfG